MADPLRRSTMLADLAGRWRWSARPALFSALAAGIAWWLAAALTNNQRPVFASVTAIVALAPGVANPRLQMLGFIVGLGTGLLIGEIARPLFVANPELLLAPAAFVAIVAASSVGRNPLTLIQSGASAVIVMGSLSADAGRVQFIDALVGGGVAATFSQLFFAPDPVPILERAIHRLTEIGSAVLSAEGHSRAAMWEAVAQTTADFEQAVATSRGVRRWTPRGRIGTKRIGTAIEHWLEPGRHLAAATALTCLSNDPSATDALARALAAVQGDTGNGTPADRYTCRSIPT